MEESEIEEEFQKGEVYEFGQSGWEKLPKKRYKSYKKNRTIKKTVKK